MVNGEKAGSILLWRTNLTKILRKIPIIKRFGKRFGPESQIEKMGSYRNIAKLFGGEFFTGIQKLNEEMVQTELAWDGLNGAGGKGSAQHLRNEVIKFYSEFNPENHQIESSIGPFVNKGAVDREYTYSDRGSCYDPETEENKFDRIPMTIDLSMSGGQPITVNFNVPPDKEIVHNGYGYKVAYFGARQGAFWSQLRSDINAICDAVENRLLSISNLTDEERKKIGENISSIKTKMGDIRDYLEEAMIAFENPQRAALGGAEKGLRAKHTDLEDKRTEVMKRALPHELVHYTHTYKVINVNNKGELLNPDGAVAKDADGNPLSLPQNFRQGKEEAPGLDEHGWPLEVGDGRTLFEGRVLPLGTVVLDFYDGHSPNGGTPRNVDQRFTRDWDLLDVVVWVYVSFDAKRDDLRDARYHKNAITVMDRIMTELGIKGHPQTMERISAGKQAGDSKEDSEKIKMRLNKLAGNPLRLASDPDEVEMTIKPTHVNPAFDMRVTAKDKHIGRRYYYDLQENIFNHQSENPTITSRGAALYILHRVIEETKYWGGGMSQGRAGVIEVLEEIGKRISGYDIGPNMGYEEGKTELKGWGRPLPINPFKTRGR